MRLFASALLALFTLSAASGANEAIDRARDMELKGDARGARSLLAKAAAEPGAAIEILEAYAAFQDRRGDPEARQA